MTADSFYIGLWRWGGNQRENILTECVASALRADRVLLRGWLRAIGVPGSASGPVLTQVASDSDWHDLEIRVGTRTYCIEHKLDAPLGHAQLERYLNKKAIAGVALVSKRTHTITPDIRSHRKYLHPKAAQHGHFQWTDFYSLVHRRSRARGSHVLVRELALLLKHLGFDPPLPGLSLNDDDPTVKHAARLLFRDYWTDVRRFIAKRRWTVVTGSTAQIYTWPVRGLAKRILLDPLDHGSIKLRFDTSTMSKATLLAARLTPVARRNAFPVDIEVARPQRAHGKACVVDARISLRLLLGQDDRPHARQLALTRFVLPFITAAIKPDDA